VEGPLGSEKRKYSPVLSHSLIAQRRNTLDLIGIDSDLFSVDLGLLFAFFPHLCLVMRLAIGRVPLRMGPKNS
jgi:hypothetical protein